MAQEEYSRLSQITGQFQQVAEQALERWETARQKIAKGKYSSGDLMSEMLAGWTDVLSLWSIPLGLLQGSAAPAGKTVGAPGSQKGDTLPLTPSKGVKAASGILILSDPTITKVKAADLKFSPPNQGPSIPAAQVDAHVDNGALTVIVMGLDNPSLKPGNYNGSITNAADDSIVAKVVLTLPK